MDRIKSLFISLIIIGACTGITYADEAFTPLNFSDPTYTSATESHDIIAAEPVTSNKTVTPAVSNASGNSNMQSAITQLDSAQVEVRNELLKYKTQYSEVDANYNKVKEERADLAKKIKACEKKIKQLDKTKEKIRKNMV